MFRKTNSRKRGAEDYSVRLGVGIWVPDEASTVFVHAEGTSTLNARVSRVGIVSWITVLEDSLAVHPSANAGRHAWETEER